VKDYPDLYQRRPNNATHSTWWVIGKAATVLSVHAILCARLP